ncbi:MAG: O-antigen ligase family protein [Verrucomicrobia bacterium]|nr:O-antigen ligase family protein [Verrucomicrobiota bacterium]
MRYFSSGSIGKNPLLLGFFFAIFLTFGLSVSIVGRLFYADIGVVIMAMLYFADQARSGGGKKNYILLIAAAVFLTLVTGMDLINRIPMPDLYRGLARNAIFFASIFAGMYLVKLWGLNRAILLILIVSVAPFVAHVFWVGRAFDLSFAIRYSGAGTLGLIVVLLCPFAWLQLAVMTVLSLAYAFYFDMRAGAALTMTGMLLFPIRRIVCYFKKWVFVLLAIGLAVALVPLVIEGVSLGMEDGSTISRHAASNSQRSSMAQTAWDGFKSSPFFGNGSWQHARKYFDDSMTEEFIGVHSWILQLAFEYGILGLCLGVGVGILGLVGIWLFAFHSCEGLIPSGIAIIGGVLAQGVFYGALFNPFAGYTRIDVGLTCGVIVGLNRAYEANKLARGAKIVRRFGGRAI